MSKHGNEQEEQKLLLATDTCKIPLALLDQKIIY